MVRAGLQRDSANVGDQIAADRQQRHESVQVESLSPRASSKVIHQTGLTVEFDRDRYNEPAPTLGNFSGDRVGVYVHWVR